MINGLERMALMRIQKEAVKQSKIDELEWEQFCKDYFLNHNFCHEDVSLITMEIYEAKILQKLKGVSEKIQLEQSKGKKVAV